MIIQTLVRIDETLLPLHSVLGYRDPDEWGRSVASRALAAIQQFLDDRTETGTTIYAHDLEPVASNIMVEAEISVAQACAKFQTPTLLFIHVQPKIEFQAQPGTDRNIH